MNTGSGHMKLALRACALAAAMTLVPGITQAWEETVITNDLGHHPRQRAVDFLIGEINARLGAIPSGSLVRKATSTVSSASLFDTVATGAAHLGIASFSSAVRPNGVGENSALVLRLIISPPPFLGITARKWVEFLYDYDPDGGGPLASGVDLIQRIVDDMAGNFNGDLTDGDPSAVIVLPYIVEPEQHAGWFPGVVTGPGSFPAGFRVRLNRLEADIFSAAFPGTVAGGGVPGVSPINGLCGFGPSGKIFDAIEFAYCEEDRDVLFLGGSNPVTCGAAHLYVRTWHDQSAQGSLLVNRAWLAGLPAGEQQAILDAARASTLAALQRGEDAVGKCQRGLKDEGAIVQEKLPKSVMAALEQAARAPGGVFDQFRSGAASNAADGMNFDTLLKAYEDFAATH